MILLTFNFEGLSGLVRFFQPSKVFASFAVTSNYVSLNARALIKKSTIEGALNQGGAHSRGVGAH